MKNDDKEKEVADSVRNLLQVNEEFKIISSSDQKDLNYINKLVTKQSAEVNKLAKMLLITTKRTLNRVSTLEQCKDEMTARVDSQQQAITELTESIKKLEMKEVKKLFSKLENYEKMTETDIETVNELITNYSTEFRLYYLKALILENLDRDNELSEFVEKLLKEDPKNYCFWYLRALFLSKGLEKIADYNKALQLMGQESYLKHSIYHDYALYLLGFKKFETALDNINKALAADSKCARAWNVKGKVLLKLGKTTEALGCIDTGLRLDEKEGDLWMSKGEALQALGADHFEEALKCFNKSIKLDPKNKDVYILKSLLLLESNKYEDALTIIEDQIKIDEEDPCMHYYKGCILIEMKRPDKAIEAFNRVFAITGGLSGCPSAVTALAQTYGTFGYSKELIEFAKSVLQNQEIWNKFWSKDDADEVKAFLYNTIAWYFFKNNVEMDEALRIAQEAAVLKPNNPMFLDTLACVLTSKGKDKEAFATFKKAIKLKENEEQITWDILSSLYKRLGKEKKAEEALEVLRNIKESKTN